MNDERREIFRFMPCSWDVTKAKKLIRERPNHPVETTAIEVADMMKLAGVVAINRDRVAELSFRECKVPGILAQVPFTGDDKPYFILIDGWHRLVQLHERGQEVMEVIVLTDEENEACMFGLPIISESEREPHTVAVVIQDDEGDIIDEIEEDTEHPDYPMKIRVDYKHDGNGVFAFIDIDEETGNINVMVETEGEVQLSVDGRPMRRS
jgi:hypothetical protein